MVEVSYLYDISYHISLLLIAWWLIDVNPLSDDLTTDGQFYIAPPTGCLIPTLSWEVCLLLLWFSHLFLNTNSPKFQFDQEWCTNEPFVVSVKRVELLNHYVSGPSLLQVGPCFQD